MKDTKRAKKQDLSKEIKFTNTWNPPILRAPESYTKKITQNNLTS